MLRRFYMKFCYEMCFKQRVKDGHAFKNVGCSGKYPNYNSRTDCYFCPYYVDECDEILD